MRRLAPWLGPLIVLLIELPLIWTTPHVGEWFVFWYVGHLVATGATPYDPANWAAATTDYGPVAHGLAINTANGLDISALPVDSRWIWPPIVGLVLAPFGAFPLEVGIPLLHVATIVVAIASTIALVRVLAPPAVRPLALALLFASPSLVQPMRAATMTILVLPGIALLFAALRNASAWRLAVAGFAVAVRPQLFLISLPFVLSAFVRRGARRTLAISALLWTVANAIAFALSPVPLDPRLLDAARAFTLQDNSSTWRLAYELAPDAILPVVVMLVAMGAALAAVAVRRAGPGQREEVLVAAALALAIAVVPYVHTYDHLALFPIWLLGLRAAAGTAGAGRLAIGGAVVTVALGFAWSAYLVGAAGTRAAAGVTPFLALGVLALTSARVATDGHEPAAHSATAPADHGDRSHAVLGDREQRPHR